MLVMKFGGASVATPESFLKIADIILERMKVDPHLVVVVSAMGKTTDDLCSLAQKVHPNPPKREWDMLISTGERVSIALLAMALAFKGQEAVSFTGSQSGIITCERHTDAKIVDVRPHRLVRVLEKGSIPIVAGFQGVSRQGDITTLGRNGSDTTAVALAVGLGADRVEFYKDVPGIFQEDPKLNPHTNLIPQLSFQEAIQLVSKGAKILHLRSLVLAYQNGIPISLRSFDAPSKVGSWIGHDSLRNKEKKYETEGSE